jgi:hypothetical protein
MNKISPIISWSKSFQNLAVSLLIGSVVVADVCATSKEPDHQEFFIYITSAVGVHESETEFQPKKAYNQLADPGFSTQKNYDQEAGLDFQPKKGLDSVLQYIKNQEQPISFILVDSAFLQALIQIVNGAPIVIALR